NVALENAAFDPRKVIQERMDFNIVVPTTKITNQKQSGRCWMFAVMNMLRERTIKKLNVEDFSFSGAYLAFYDKLEKCNNFFESIIAYSDQDIDDRETYQFLEKPLGDGGEWEMCAGLIQKYGLVPYWIMPETSASNGTAQHLNVFNRKLREDALRLREAMKNGSDVDALRVEMLQEIYNGLCVLYGQPPKSFDLEYTDKDKNYHSVKGLTPIQFFEEYVGNDLDDYAVIICNENRAFYEVYDKPWQMNLVEKSYAWLNLPMEEMEKITIDALKKGELVMFSCDSTRYGERALGYWDPDCWKFEEILGMKLSMSAKESLLSHDSTTTHCMCFCGVNLDENGVPDRWKIENSWGKENGQEGYYICSESYFHKYVYQVIVPKHVLSDEQKAMFNKPVVPMKVWENV
ncbi:MAG: hypothetical protein HUJ56_06720, partial [Erysipelotrichaceae bacterium]|nr:hypothetical protein [Erysipelotrichaceae bacterium]